MKLFCYIFYIQNTKFFTIKNLVKELNKEFELDYSSDKFRKDYVNPELVSDLKLVFNSFIPSKGISIGNDKVKESIINYLISKPDCYTYYNKQFKIDGKSYSSVVTINKDFYETLIQQKQENSIDDNKLWIIKELTKSLNDNEDYLTYPSTSFKEILYNICNIYEVNFKNMKNFLKETDVCIKMNKVDVPLKDGIRVIRGCRIYKLKPDVLKKLETLDETENEKGKVFKTADQSFIDCIKSKSKSKDTDDEDTDNFFKNENSVDDLI